MVMTVDSFFQGVWMVWSSLVIAGCFVSYAIHFTAVPAFAVLGPWLVVAKACAGALLPTTALLMLTMCRRTLGSLYDFRFLPFSSARTGHIVLGSACLVLAIVHACMHLCGTLPVIATQPTIDNTCDPAVTAKLQAMGEPLVSLCGADYWHLVLLSRPAWTGWLMLLSLCAMAVTATPVMRRTHFEVFQRTHLLAIIFLVALLLHASAHIVEQPRAYIWVCVPIVVYIVERIINAFYRTQLHVHSCGPAGNGVCILSTSAEVPNDLSSAVQTIKPGQYVLLQCDHFPLQSHPFVCMSTPNEVREGRLHFSISAAGDWTSHVCWQLHRNCSSLQISCTPALGSSPVGGQGKPVPLAEVAGMIVVAESAGAAAKLLPVYRWLLEQNRSYEAKGRHHKKAVPWMDWHVLRARPSQSFLWLLETLRWCRHDDMRLRGGIPTNHAGTDVVRSRGDDAKAADYAYHDTSALPSIEQNQRSTQDDSFKASNLRLYVKTGLETDLLDKFASRDSVRPLTDVENCETFAQIMLNSIAAHSHQHPVAAEKIRDEVDQSPADNVDANEDEIGHVTIPMLASCHRPVLVLYVGSQGFADIVHNAASLVNKTQPIVFRQDTTSFV